MKGLTRRLHVVEVQVLKVHASRGADVMTGRCLGNDPMRASGCGMVATEMVCCALQCRTGQGSKHEHPLGRDAGPIASGICNAGEDDCMLCDAVGETWLATARCCWQLDPVAAMSPT